MTLVRTIRSKIMRLLWHGLLLHGFFQVILLCVSMQSLSILSDFSSVTFRLVADDYVMNDSGTGIVHCAPVFGADDYRVCLENEIIKKIVRDFKRPDGLKDTEIDAAVDKDESLKNEGVAREHPVMTVVLGEHLHLTVGD
ncbi:unnamed protein product [Arabidopsis thaliana]|uniref:Uncharacterized protein n=1 Tax=Arabidopsis thaliana TaxID=3702 RepID=A0A5S9XET4_ARATH|nr:unnamed protein product [Arabidopsis thaliana]